MKMTTEERTRAFARELDILIADHGTAYAAGFFHSILANWLAQLPVREQKRQLAALQERNGYAKIQVVNSLTGQPVEIYRCQKGTVCDPSMESYHTM